MFKLLQYKFLSKKLLSTLDIVTHISLSLVQKNIYYKPEISIEEFSCICYRLKYDYYIHNFNLEYYHKPCTYYEYAITKKHLECMKLKMEEFNYHVFIDMDQFRFFKKIYKTCPDCLVYGITLFSCYLKDNLECYKFLLKRTKFFLSNLVHHISDILISGARKILEYVEVTYCEENMRNILDGKYNYCSALYSGNLDFVNYIIEKGYVFDLSKIETSITISAVPKYTTWHETRKTVSKCKKYLLSLIEKFYPNHNKQGKYYYSKTEDKIIKIE